MTRSWLGLAGLFALTLGAQQCGRARSTSRPELAWDGETYTAVWRRGGDIYVHIEGRPPQIVYSHATVGDPTIAITAAGALISTSRAADGERAWRDEIVIPLDRDGVPGEPRIIRHAVSAERTCASRQSSGFLVTAYAGHLRDGRPGEVLSVYDRRGVQIASELSVSPFLDRECAIIEHDGELAFVERSEWNLVVSVRTVPDLEWVEDPFAIPIQEAERGAPWHLSATLMSRFGHSYGVLLRDREDRLRVTSFTAHGPSLTRVLDTDVDGESADLGRSDRGVFVTWTRGTTLHLRSFGLADDHVQEIRKGTRVRAASAGGQCSLALLAPDGGRVDIVDVAACP